MLLKTCVTEMSNPILRSDLAHDRPAVVGRSNNDRPMRIALYSHDTMGMGHIRRNLLIASAILKKCERVQILLIAGTREAAYFATQAGLDCVTLPALAKSSDGLYSARHLGWSLEETTRLRSKVIRATMEEFAPDLFVVDKIPRGIGNELVPTLEYLRKANTRCILGLRDVLDEPEVVAREWLRDANDAAIEAYFNELWIYGDQQIYDCLSEYNFTSAVSSRAYFTGYLNQTTRYPSTSNCGQLAGQSKPPVALCVVGGGQDGFQLAEAFVQATMPKGWQGIVITGPFMPKDHQQRLHQLAQANGSIEVIDHLVETDEYLQSAERVIAMGGYNTVTSVLSFRKASLIVPRMVPRQEQWIRAQRLAKLGWISVLTPPELDSMQLSSWLHRDVVPQPNSESVDLLGLDRISQRVNQWSRQLAPIAM